MIFITYYFFIDLNWSCLHLQQIRILFNIRYNIEEKHFINFNVFNHPFWAGEIKSNCFIHYSKLQHFRQKYCKESFPPWPSLHHVSYAQICEHVSIDYQCWCRENFPGVFENFFYKKAFIMYNKTSVWLHLPLRI